MPGELDRLGTPDTPTPTDIPSDLDAAGADVAEDRQEMDRLAEGDSVVAPDLTIEAAMPDASITDTTPTMDVPRVDLGVDAPRDTTPADVAADSGGRGDTPDAAPDVSCSSGTIVCGGRCVATAEDPTNCGACGRVCTAPHGVNACVGGTCRLSGCLEGYQDCDFSDANGCERNVLIDPDNCGGCGLPCSFPEAMPACVAGRCAIAACNRRYLDCDGNTTNGCEVDLLTNSRNCEVCGSVCLAGGCSSGCNGVGTFPGYAVAPAPTEVVWVDACAQLGMSRVLLNSDQEYARGEIPFPVPFWGRTQRRYVVTPDGLVGFGLDLYLEAEPPRLPPYRSWGALPTNNIPYPAVFAFGVDLVTGPEGVCIATLGVAPSRRFVVEWSGARFVAFGALPPDASVPRVTFEAIFYETLEQFDLLYQAPFSTPAGPTIMAQTAVTIGIVLEAGSSGRAAPATSSVGAGTRLRFSRR